MMRKKYFLSLLLVFCTQLVFAQKKIVLEKMRVLSVTGPVMKYLQNPGIIKTIVSQLNTTLQQYQQFPLADTTALSIELPVNGKDLYTVKPNFTDPDTTHLHLYWDVFELYPSTFFEMPENRQSDTSLMKRAKSVFSIEAWILSWDKKIVFHEGIGMVVSPSETPGMGTLYNKGIRFTELNITPKGFTEMLKAATNLLLDPKNELAMVEIKAAPVYLSDNYILPKTLNQPRTYVVNNKNISTYTYKEKSEIIRMGEPVYEEILLKGKKAQKYPDDITNAIKTDPHFSSSDFVFLRQECRDVVRDKNYLVKLTTQVDADEPPLLGPLFAFTDFIGGEFHYLFLEKDTLAKFIIEKSILDTKSSTKILTDIISNGYDSSSLFRINTEKNEVPVLYDYIVKGKISSRDFTIKCSGVRNSLKEIYLDQKLVCIAQGKFNPEKFVIFDASLNPEILNQLFIIGFNRFFE